MAIITFDIAPAKITLANNFQFNEVWHVTEWRDKQIYKTKFTGLYIINALIPILNGIDYIITSLDTKKLQQLMTDESFNVDIIIGWKLS